MGMGFQGMFLNMFPDILLDLPSSSPISVFLHRYFLNTFAFF